MIKNMKRIENLASSPPMPDGIVTSNSPPPPAAFDPTLMFYNSMYDTVKKGKAGKGARKSLAESKLFGDPKTFGSFEDYGIMPSPKAKKSTKARKNAKSTTPKTPKVRKQTPPKTKRSPRKPRAAKDPEAIAAARRKKASTIANKSPRKTKKQQQQELLTDYTTQHNETSVVPSSPIASPPPPPPQTTEYASTPALEPAAALVQPVNVVEEPPTPAAITSNDIDDAEAAYILSSISQRSFHSYNQKNSGYQHYNIPLDQQHHESPSIIYYSQKDAPPIGGSYHKYFDNGSKVLYHVMLDHNYNAETPGEFLHYSEATSSCNELPATHLTDPMSFLYEVAMNAQTPPPMDVAVAPQQLTPQQMHPTVIVSPKSVDYYGKTTKKSSSSSSLSSMSLPLSYQEVSVPSPSIVCTERSTNYTLKLNETSSEKHSNYDYYQTMPLDSSQKSTINDTNNNKYETVVHGVAVVQAPTHTITTSTITTSNDDKFNVKKRWLRQVTEETATTPPLSDNHHKAPLKKRRMAREMENVEEAAIDVVNETSMNQVNIDNLINKDVLDVKEELVDAIPQIPALEVLRSLISSTPTILPVFVPKIDQPTTSKAAASSVNTKKPRKTWAYKQNKRTGKLKLTYVKKSTKNVDKVIIKDEVIDDVKSLSSDVIVPIKMDKVSKVEVIPKVEVIEFIPNVEVIPVIDKKEETKQEIIDENEIKEEEEIVDVVGLPMPPSPLPPTPPPLVDIASKEPEIDEVDADILIDDIVNTAISEEREIEKYKAEVEKFTNPGDPNIDIINTSIVMKQLEDIDVVSDVDVDIYDDDDDEQHNSNEMEHWDNVQDFLKLNLDKLSKGNAKYCKHHERRALNIPLEGLLEHGNENDDEQEPSSSTSTIQLQLHCHEPIKHSYSFDERQLSPQPSATVTSSSSLTYQRSISEIPSGNNVMYCKPMEIESPAQRMDFINFATRSNGLMNTNITTTQVPRIYGGPLSEYYSPLDVPGRTFGGRNSSFSLYPNTPAIGNFVPVTGGLRPMNGFDSYSTLMTSSNFDTKISPTGVGAFDTTRFMLNCLTPTTVTTPTIPQVNCNNSVLSEDPSWVAFSSKMGGYGKVFTKTASSDPRLNPTLVAEAKKEDVPMPKKKLSLDQYRKRKSLSTVTTPTATSPETSMSANSVIIDGTTLTQSDDS